MKICRLLLLLPPLVLLAVTSTSIDLVKGVVEISPSFVAPVCQAGDQLELTCTTGTTGIFHRWEITVFPENVTHTTTPITSIGTSGIPQPLTISTSMIVFSRLSGPNSSPLISRIVVSPVSSGLNGTVVNCFEGSSSTDSIATTTIQIIDPGQFELSIRYYREQFLRDRVTVFLEWALLNSQIYYQQFLRNVSVNADPELKSVAFTGNVRVQLVLSYNTLYNVSITQHSTCEQLIRTTFLQLNYSKCSNPRELTNAVAMGYEDPALEGQIIIFTCAPGQVLKGSNVSTCMGNGKWEPDPGEVECIRPGATATTVGQSVTPGTTTLGIPYPSPAATTAMLRIALISVICVLVMMSALTFIIGFVCGHYFSKRWRKSANKNTGSPFDPTAGPREDLELKVNVAYITIRPK